MNSLQLYRLTFWSRHSTKKRIHSLDEEDEEENEKREGKFREAFLLHFMMPYQKGLIR